nr:MAG TPA: hypothetical protein [Caudoviricetes sp.]
MILFVFSHKHLANDVFKPKYLIFIIDWWETQFFRIDIYKQELYNRY